MADGDFNLPRKPLAHAVNAGKREAMVHHPTRWPRSIWRRFVARADEKRVAIADVVRECGIAGLGYIETQEAIQEHRRATL